MSVRLQGIPRAELAATAGLLGGLVLACTGSVEMQAGGAPAAAEAAVAQPGENPIEASPPSAARLPDGGVPVDTVPADTFSQKAVDAAGNLWLWGCQGLYVVGTDEIRRYRWTDSPLANSMGGLTSDALGRTWLQTGVDLSFVEGGAWRSLGKQPPGRLTVARDGSAWTLQYLEPSGTVALHQIWPDGGADVRAPNWSRSLIAGKDGELWVTVDDGFYHFSGGRFDGPYPAVGVAGYDPVQDALAIVERSGDGLTEVRVQDGTLERLAHWDGEPVALGFDQQGHLVQASYHVATGKREVTVSDGENILATPTDQIGDADAILSPAGLLYLFGPRAVYRFEDGVATPVLEFGKPTEFTLPWSARGYGTALRETSENVSAAQLSPLSPDIAHEKVHVVGRVETAFEFATVRLFDGSLFSPYVSPEFNDFALDQRLEISAPYVSGAPAPPADPWDLSGYFDVGPCYDGSSGTGTFYVLEGYPLSLAPERRAALEADLRARYPE